MRVLIVPNIANENAVAASAELATWLTGQGIEVALTNADADACALASFGVPQTAIGEPVLVVALGGDGTILKAVHLLSETEAPVLGIKFGRLGFLSGAGAERMREAVGDALAGDVRIERRATLNVSIEMDGRAVGTYRALNEVSLSRGASGRVVGIDLAVNGTRLASFRADGVVVATATGSTAYALSAGGPIVSPEHAGMLVVPVAPHTLAARPLLTGCGDVVEISLPEPARADACVAVDGDVTPCRQAVERVVVTRGRHDVLLVKHDGRDFYETVAAEFFGG